MHADAASADHPADAFTALLRQHEGIVHKVARTYCADAADRADLAQEIAVQMWRAWPGYDPARAFSTWMYRIALNTAISWVRSTAYRLRHVEPLDPDLHDAAAAHADPHEDDAALRTLHALIARLGVLDRALLLLYLDGRNHREIGEVLGLTPTNVTTRISRLKQRIRAELE
jgi:RNA polymerase sigma-70 factor, ECF subfamily